MTDGEDLIGTSNHVSKKIEMLQKYLLQEKQLTIKLRKDVDNLKVELNQANQLLYKASVQEQLLAHKIDLLTEKLQDYPVIEHSENGCDNCARRKMIADCCAPDDIYLNDANTSTTSLYEIDSKLAQVEEELRLLKNRYEQCNQEKIDLINNYNQLQEEQNSLNNSSNTSILLFVIPLLIIIAILLAKILIG